MNPQNFFRRGDHSPRLVRLLWHRWHNGELIVRAHLLTPLAEIRALIVRKEPWILEKQAEAEAASNHLRALGGADGEAFSFLGAEVTIHRAAVSVPKLENGILYLPLSPEGPEGLRRFLKRAALTILRERTQFWVARWDCPAQESASPLRGRGGAPVALKMV